MNLAEMLSYVDIQELNRIADHYDCGCGGHSKHELIQSILHKMGRNDVFEQHVANLTIEDKRFLGSLLFEQRNAFSMEDLIARVQQTIFADELKKASNPREMIVKFKQRGWLFNGFSLHTKYLFQVPEDLKSRFGEALCRMLAVQLIHAEEPGAYRDEQQLFADDLLKFLQYLFHTEVPLTSDGTMYKKNIQQIIDLFAIQEQPIGKGGWRFGYGRRFKEYPNRFSLMYDYCYCHGLIVEQQGCLMLSETGKQKAVLAQKEDILQLYRFYIRLYKNPIPNLLALVHWVDKLTPSWVTVRSLVQALEPFIKPFYYDPAQSVLEQRVLGMLLHLGLLRLGEDHLLGAVVQMTKLGSGVIGGIYVPDEDKVMMPKESLQPEYNGRNLQLDTFVHGE